MDHPLHPLSGVFYYVATSIVAGVCIAEDGASGRHRWSIHSSYPPRLRTLRENGNDGDGGIDNTNDDRPGTMSVVASDHNITGALDLNSTSTARVGYSIVDDEIVVEVKKDEEDGTTERDMTIRMTVFFLVLMVLYIAFCAYYRKRNRVRRTVGDTTTSASTTTTSVGDGGERDRQRSENQTVLDESTDASRRARTNAEMEAKLKERLRIIQRALYVRMIIDDNDIMEKEDDDDDKEKDRGRDDNSTKTYRDATENKLPPPPQDSTTDGRGGLAVTKMAVAAAATADMSCTVDVDTVQSCHDDRTSSNAGITSDVLGSDNVPIKTNIIGGGVMTLLCTSSSNANASAHRRHCHQQQQQCATIHLTTKVSTYRGEECNICLSSFQVGDRVAWRRSDNNNEDVIDVGGEDDNRGVFAVREGRVDHRGCKHVFHEECITRWLLVRDRCPTCRESYFSDRAAATDLSTTTSGSGGTATAVTLMNEVNDVDTDLEQGRGNDDVVNVSFRSTPLIRRMIERYGTGRE